VLVDSHCHLDRLELSKHEGKLEHALAAARDKGVEKMLCVSIDLEAYPAMLELVQSFDDVLVSVGVHPNETEGHDPCVDELVQLAQNPRVIAIGETGLDYHYNQGDLEWQRDRFRTHIRAAIACGKPLIIHSREAKADVLAIMKEENAQQAGGVMHCFVDDWETAQRAMEMGFYISFSGIVTFKNAVELKQVATKMPLERMLVETDSPYLAPVPFRGKPNEPAYVLHVAEHIAELRNTTLEEIARVTTENFNRLFKLR
jgi:TatD DNase family protein